MLVAGEGPPDKRAGAPTPSKVILTTGNFVGDVKNIFLILKQFLC